MGGSELGRQFEGQHQFIICNGETEVNDNNLVLFFVSLKNGVDTKRRFSKRRMLQNNEITKQRILQKIGPIKINLQ